MQRHPSAEGFTLIEVLLATAIVGFLLLGIAQLFIMAAYVNVGAQNMTMATIPLSDLVTLTRSFGKTVRSCATPAWPTRRPPMSPRPTTGHLRTRNNGCKPTITS